MENKFGKYVESYQRDLKFKNYAELTIKGYVCQIWLFLNHFKNVAKAYKYYLPLRKQRKYGNDKRGNRT